MFFKHTFKLIKNFHYWLGSVAPMDPPCPIHWDVICEAQSRSQGNCALIEKRLSLSNQELKQNDVEEMTLIIH